MSEMKYLKCPCQKCGASIEFPAHGIGSAVPCPHCGEKTTLLAPPVVAERGGRGEVGGESSDLSLLPSPLTPPAPRSRVMAMAFVALILAGAGGALFAFRDKFSASKLATSNGSASTGNQPVPAARNSEPAQTGASTPVGKGPKSIDDLKIGAITLEKAKGSSLVYAVGVLRNESDHQRFGVNIELELADARGARAGAAKDYRSVIEPRQEWRFRALVLDTKAVSAKLSKIREEE